MIHIKDFVLQARLGGGDSEWDFIEEVSNHCYKEYNFDIDERAIEDVNHFGEVLYVFYNEIKDRWEKYIQQKEKDTSISLEIEAGDGMDFDYHHNYQWDMTKKEAYETWKEERLIQNNDTSETKIKKNNNNEGEV